MRNSVFKPRSYDRMVNFCSPKVTFCVNFIPSRCRICRDLRVFIGVKFSLEDLLRVKDLTFRNSATGASGIENIRLGFLEAHLTQYWKTLFLPDAQICLVPFFHQLC